jgi:hypothetical protein
MNQLWIIQTSNSNAWIQTLAMSDEWKQALYNYDKNDDIGLVAQPTPIEKVPKDKR